MYSEDSTGEIKLTIFYKISFVSARVKISCSIICVKAVAVCKPIVIIDFLV